MGLWPFQEKQRRKVIEILKMMANGSVRIGGHIQSRGLSGLDCDRTERPWLILPSTPQSKYRD